MNKRIRFVAAVALIFGLCGTANAVVTIDFGPGFGAPASGHSVLTNQLAAYGVTFSTTDPEGVYWWGGDYSWAPGQYTIHAGGLGATQAIDPIRVDFATEVISASIRGFDGGGDVDTLLLQAFDSSDTLVDSMSITNVFSNPGLVASVAGAGISYITFEVSVPGDHGLFFDDLTFQPVPLPAAVWLFGSALLGLFGIRKGSKDIPVQNP